MTLTEQIYCSATKIEIQFASPVNQNSQLFAHEDNFWNQLIDINWKVWNEITPGLYELEQHFESPCSIHEYPYRGKFGQYITMIGFGTKPDEQPLQ